MNISKYLSINEILSDVVRNCNDEDMRTKPIGWYKRQVKIALDELNFRTNFDIRYEDFDIPSNHQLSMPNNSFNIKDIFVYNGDCFDIDSSHRVHHKDMIRGSGTGYTAKVKTGQYDYFNSGFNGDDQVLFYNIQNGIIYFSDYIDNYDKIRIVYSGLASDVDEAKMIPAFIREAVVGYVCINFCKSQMVGNPNMASMYRVFKEDLYGRKSNYELSTWDEAKHMLNKLDTKQRTDINETWGRFNA